MSLSHLNRSERAEVLRATNAAQALKQNAPERNNALQVRNTTRTAYSDCIKTTKNQHAWMRLLTGGYGLAWSAALGMDLFANSDFPWFLVFLVVNGVGAIDITKLGNKFKLQVGVAQALENDYREKKEHFYHLEAKNDSLRHTFQDALKAHPPRSSERRAFMALVKEQLQTSKK